MHTLSNDTTLNDLQWPLTLISRSRHFSTLNVSETTPDRAIVTIERQLEVICALSNGDLWLRFQGYWRRISQNRCML